MMRKPWHTKAPYASMPKIATRLGECVSVDQLDATLLGIIAQIKRIPTTKCYICATIFVYHYSRLSYVPLQQTLSSEDTVQAKRAFKTFAYTHGVKIHHHHADNGHFADNAFCQDLKANNQTIMFCSVNAH
jgi:hypothetical protein